jgi:hypothetical protein
MVIASIYYFLHRLSDNSVYFSLDIELENHWTPLIEQYSIDGQNKNKDVIKEVDKWYPGVSNR